MSDVGEVRGVVQSLLLGVGTWDAVVDGHFIRGGIDVMVPPRGREVTAYGVWEEGLLRVASIHLHQLGQEEGPSEHVASFSLAQKFEHFHHLNPQVLWHIEQIARELQRAGHPHGSVKLIFERLRWLHALATLGDTDGFKLNNNHHAFYARVLMKKCPGFDGFFKLRRQRVPYEPDLAVLGLVPGGPT